MMMMKNMNSSNRDGSNVSYKEGTKLLDMDTDSTDSDTQEHFALPPLDLKGARKKPRLKFSGDGIGNGCHSYWRGCAIFLLLLAIGCTAVIGYFTYRLNLEVQQLRDKISPIEHGNQGNPKEFHDLHSSVKDLLNNQTTIKSFMKIERDNVTEIFKQLLSLNTTLHGLSSSVGTVKDYKNLPSTLLNMREEIAKMGSNIEDFKNEMKPVQEFKDAASKQFGYIQGNVTLIGNIRKLLDTINDTLSYDIGTLKMLAASQKMQIDQHNQTINFISHTLHDPPANAAIDIALIKTIISDQIKNVSLGGPNMEQIDELSSQISNINEVYQQLQFNNRNITDRLTAFTLSVQDQMTDLTNAVHEHEQEIADLKAGIASYESTVRETIHTKSTVDTGIEPDQLLTDQQFQSTVDSRTYAPQAKPSSKSDYEVSTKPPIMPSQSELDVTPKESTPESLEQKDLSANMDTHNEDTGTTEDDSGGNVRRRGVESNSEDIALRKEIIHALERSNNKQ